jgi:hypothetical protein
VIRGRGGELLWPIKIKSEKWHTRENIRKGGIENIGKDYLKSVNCIIKSSGNGSSNTKADSVALNVVKIIPHVFISIIEIKKRRALLLAIVLGDGDI